MRRKKMDSKELNDFFKEVRERDNKLRERYYGNNKTAGVLQDGLQCGKEYQ